MPLAQASGIRIVSNAIGYAGCALLFALACSDLHARRLPNPLILGFCMLYAVRAWLTGVPFNTLEQHAALALAVLLAGAALFAAGRIGAGDAKLASALALWVGPHGAMPLLVLTSLAGLVVAAAGLIADSVARFVAPLSALAWTLGLVSARRGVPYGVALAASGVIALLPRPLVIG